MNAPDKICVAPHQISDYDLDIQEVGHNGAEEYIRKDAIIGWLRERESLAGVLKKEAYQSVIEKINSL